MVNLSKVLPIYDITKKGIIISDSKGALTLCFEMILPVVFTMGGEDYEDLVEKFRTFLELLGQDVIIHKQDIYHREYYSADEAWQAISSPEMANFMKSQVKVIRKYGGQTIFISQELDDFISSDVIKESIINNSSIKIFADMGSFAQKFEPIKKALSISDNNELKIKSLNKNNRKNAFYKEICICWEQQGQVYAVEVPTELKAIFETDADEVGKILPQFQEYGVELTAINYADR